ncbi:MAG: ribosome silencing factor [Pseudomonadota bacterium]
MEAQDQAEVDTLSLVLGSLEDEKAEDVVSIDLSGKSSIADHMVIASGRSSRHVAAICEKLMDKLKASTGARPRAEGVEHGDWALIDASDVIVHVFRPEVRSFYALEKMWSPETVASRAAKDAAQG